MIRSAKALLALATVVFLCVQWSAAARAEFKIESIDNDFPYEIKEAAEQGKSLVIMFHQAGCPYCDKMRARVFPVQKVDEFYSKHFVLIESNIRGDLPVVSPEGKEMTEKRFARGIRVRATPVFIFFDKEGKSVLRVTGFLDAEKFNKAGKYVLDGVYKTKKSLFRYFQEN